MKICKRGCRNGDNVFVATIARRHKHYLNRIADLFSDYQCDGPTYAERPKQNAGVMTKGWVDWSRARMLDSISGVL